MDRLGQRAEPDNVGAGVRGSSRAGRLRVGMRACALGAMLAVAACGPSFKHTANLESTGSTIICFGDSITRGFGASSGNTYPERLSALIGRPVVNAGVDGDTTASALRRLERDVLAHDPWIVIVELGGNDLLRRVPETETRQNMDQIVEQCIRAGAIVVLVHAKFGVLMSDPYIETFETIADRHGAVLIPHTLKGILGNPSRMYDQIHPNDGGYALLAERIAAIVNPLIVAAEKARQ